MSENWQRALDYLGDELCMSTIGKPIRTADDANDVSKLREMLDAAEARGAAEERKKVVAWLRSDASAKIGKLPGNPCYMMIGKFERDVMARDIERGDHDPSAQRETSEIDRTGDATTGAAHYPSALMAPAASPAAVSEEPGAVCAACHGSGYVDITPTQGHGCFVCDGTGRARKDER